MTLLAVIYPAVYVVFTAVTTLTQPPARRPPAPAAPIDLDHYLLPEPT